MTEQWIDDDHCQHTVRDSEYDDWDTADDYCCHCECCCTCLGCEYGPRDGMLMNRADIFEVFAEQIADAVREVVPA